MNFEQWLNQPEPNWKTNLETCDPNIFNELKISKEKLIKILEKLDEYNVLQTQ